MNKTTIAWTNYTWNPIRGCLAVSPGCDSCYAAELAARFGDTPQFQGFAKRAPSGRAYFTGKTAFLPKKLREPLGAKPGVKVFVGSMADLFHPNFRDDELDQVFDVMEQRPDVTFQLLTKRPERMAQYTTQRLQRQLQGTHTMLWGERLLELTPGTPTLAPHIWCGTSVEDQKRANERIPLLLQVPAAVRFLSLEPLLAPVSLEQWLWRKAPDAQASPFGWVRPGAARRKWPATEDWYLPAGDLHWAIVGGESGRFRRPMDDEWVRALRDQCVEAKVAFFFKQAGGLKSRERPYLDGYKYEQYPGDLALPTPYGTCPGEDITDAFTEAVLV